MSKEKVEKCYVNVLAAFREDGRIFPRKISFDDGKVYEIEKILDLRPAAAIKAGGQGDRYTVKIKGKETKLFFEHNEEISDTKLGRWFVEK